MTSKSINILATGTGCLFGQGIIKSLKKSSIAKQIKIIGTDYFPNTPGSFWCDHNYILPDILKEGVSESEWIDSIEEIIQKHEISIIFPGAELELSLFAKYKKHFFDKFKCKVVVCDESAIDIGNDKYLTYLFLKENNFNHPLSCLPDEFENSGINFPCIVKPRLGGRSIGVSLVEKKEDMQDALKKADYPIIQEYIGTPNQEYTCGVLYFNNKIQESIVLQRTLKDGNTKTATYRHDFPKQITTYIREVGSLLKADGAVNFQLRLDSHGVPKIFEINPRHSGTTYIRCLFGYNEVDMILRNTLGMEQLPIKLKEGTVVRYFEEILF